MINNIFDHWKKSESALYMFDGHTCFGSLRLYDEFLNSLKSSSDFLKITDAIIYIYVPICYIFLYTDVNIFFLFIKNGAGLISI